MRLIDGDTLKERFEMLAYDDWNQGTGTTWARAFEESADVVECAPTIDAVEVVRCKDCKWGEEKCGNIECDVDMNVPPEYHGYEWFCPNGERREDD